MINVEINKADLRDMEYVLSQIKGGAPRALSRALNKTVTGTKTELVALIRADYNYTVAAIRNRLSDRKSTIATLSAQVKSTGRSPNLKDVVGTVQRLSGVSVNVKKSTGRRIVKHAFIAKGQKSGKILVFVRARDGGRLVARHPILTQSAAHPEVIYNTKENWGKIQSAVDTRMKTNLAHEVDVVLRGIA